AAGKPNIITGKNPAWYIPVTPSSPVPAQKFPISLIPATSTQTTEFSAWCNPTGISKRLKNPYKPAPTAPKLLIPVPRATSALYTGGELNIRIKVQKSIVLVAQIAR